MFVMGGVKGYCPREVKDEILTIFKNIKDSRSQAEVMMNLLKVGVMSYKPSERGIDMLFVIEIGKDKEGKTLYIVFETRMSREFSNPGSICSRKRPETLRKT
jgi:hypothetical protein